MATYITLNDSITTLLIRVYTHCNQVDMLSLGPNLSFLWQINHKYCACVPTNLFTEIGITRVHYVHHENGSQESSLMSQSEK